MAVANAERAPSVAFGAAQFEQFDNLSIGPSPFMAETPVGAPVAEIAPARGNALTRNLRRAGAVLVASLAFGASAPEAEAQTSMGTPELISQKTETLFSVTGNSAMTAESFAKATVLGNHRVVSKAKIIKAQKAGNCVTLDGSKTSIWTQGRHERGLPYGKDTRISRFCRIGKSWFRAACGNRAKFTLPKKAIKGRIIWVNSFNKAKLRVSASSTATARAECKTPNSSALAYGHGEGYGKAEIKISTLQRAKGKLKSLITSSRNRAEGTASSKATASAEVKCNEQATTQQPTTPPKDGNPGAGEGTPGHTNPDGAGVGGEGAGGQPGEGDGEMCRDTETGEVRPAEPNEDADQFGYCSNNTGGLAVRYAFADANNSERA